MKKQELLTQTIPHARHLIKEAFFKEVKKKTGKTFLAMFTPIVKEVYRKLGFKRKTYKDFFKQVIQDRTFKRDMMEEFKKET